MFRPPLVAGLLTFSSMSFPTDTYEALAFLPLETMSPVTDGYLALTIPAYRARVRFYAVDDYNLTVMKKPRASNPECLKCQSCSDVPHTIRILDCRPIDRQLGEAMEPVV